MSVAFKAVQVPQKYGSGMYAGETPRPGYKFVGFNCTVKNVNAKDRDVAFDFWELRDTQGGVYQYGGRQLEGINTFGSAPTNWMSVLWNFPP
jgi:hypothetical protein